MKLAAHAAVFVSSSADLTNSNCAREQGCKLLDDLISSNCASEQGYKLLE